MVKEEKSVCVVGLGHIGLPLACLLATSGYQVTGVDINPKVVSQVRSGHSIDPEPKLEQLLQQSIKNQSLIATTEVTSADVHIIAVPTLLGPDNQPDISYVRSAAKAILPHIKKEGLILIESTCPVGTTHHILKMLDKHSSDIFLAYCPERVLPGNLIHELLYNHRIVGGVNRESMKRAVAFYQSFVKGEVVGTDAKTAEAVKLAENAYRDINIAYANELSMIAHRLGLNAQTIIELANKHPRTDILTPGPGVGGHCIAIDPWYLVASAPDIAHLTLAARRVNTDKAKWVVNQVQRVIKQKKGGVVACLGLTYKPNVSSLEQSPALAIANLLEQEAEVIRVDPYVPYTMQIDEALDRAEIIVGLVAHREFRLILPSTLKGKTVLDFAGCLA